MTVGGAFLLGTAFIGNLTESESVFCAILVSVSAYYISFREKHARKKL